MNLPEIIVIIVYSIFMLFILAYSISQFFLLRHFRKATKQPPKTFSQPQDWPSVSVQLPIYNEKYVVQRLLRAISNLKYPKDKLIIQVLDDSTDETTSIIDREVERIRKEGFQVQVIRRLERDGFKAGALKNGMLHCQSEFVAIFDADFVPETDFLKRLIPQFSTPDIGMVQARWGHLNRDQSRLTAFQAFALDAHFTVEQGGRYHGGHFMNFNGTAGVWRSECIRDAGGWQSDTLTEDLDLSYRAQLKGWRFVYDMHTAAPAELPITAAAVRSQQYRWIKGAAECAVKLLPQMMRSNIALKTKYHAFFHLLNSMVFVSVFFTSILSVPLLWVLVKYPQYKHFFAWGAVFLMATVVLVAYYHESVKAIKAVHPLRFLPQFALFLATVMALSFHNSVAALQGYFGKKTPFERTPKYNVSEKESLVEKLAYHNLRRSFFPVAEVALGAIFLGAAVYGIVHQEFGLLFYHLLLAAGYFVWGGFSLSQQITLRRYRSGAPAFSISIPEA